jgi:hypothetical protein
MGCSIYASDFEGNIYTLDCATGSATFELSIRKYLDKFRLETLRDIACHGGTMWGIAGDALIRIDIKNNRAVFIGPTTFTGVNALAISSERILYAATESGDLIWLDPVTGNGTLIANYGGGLGSTGDLAFDCNDNLYATANRGGGGDLLLQVNVNTGVPLVLGGICEPSVTGLAFYCCQLYGVTSRGLVITINPDSAQADVMRQEDIRFSGMTVCCNNCGCGC